ncbi:Gamma-glutamyltranspeptidase 1 [Branchiostoma belcheri]|nr:Gamma-glutamyltranspeptidase 1 [Branchiostoma belcheri]
MDYPGLEPGQSLGGPNFIRPGKRPVSSMTPTVVVDGNGDVRLVTGRTGRGFRISLFGIVKYHNGLVISQVLMQHLWFGLEIGPAVETPRLHHQLLPDLLFTEKTRPFKPEAVLEGLRKKNHVTKRGVISAASDSRKGGFPVDF